MENSENKNSFMNYKPQVGHQIGTDDPIEQLLLNMINFNIPNQHTYDGLVLLQKILQNIMKNPKDVKYQSLKKDNEKLKNSLFNITFIPQLLSHIGFIEMIDMFQIFELTDEIYDNIRKTSRSLQHYISSFVVLSEGDPKLQAIVEGKKQKFEEEKAYKESIIAQFEKNKQQVMSEHQDGSRKKQYEQKQVNSTGLNQNQSQNQ